MRPNRPHIPSIITDSKSADTKQTTHPNFGRICRLASRFSVRRSFVAASPTSHPAFPRHVCFGEAVFTSGCRSPQGKKCRRGKIFAEICDRSMIVGVFAAVRGRLPAFYPPTLPHLPLFQAKSAPRWVIRPPETVSAIPNPPKKSLLKVFG